ncbi:MAG TPA: M20/M25/M40 family metallo-hydrolase [Thermoanaerobaculia bacterium]|nr:M20/M25/M40 family metallo-hydrolase [Thermoanaerobaculia bacterium]
MKRVLLPWLGPLLVLVVLLIRWQGPAPKAANAPPHEFSAARAFGIEQQLFAGLGPHPIGSPAAAIVRTRILGVLQSLGYETHVEESFACDAHAECGTVRNVIAHEPGMPSRPAILLLAHYDSVPAGPGASDDGTGVATLLEIARAVRGESFRNPLLIVFTEGEEGGLLGAEAFAADPHSPDVATVVNIDNRGTSRASLLYETSSNDRLIIDRVVHALPQPVTSSLFSTIYDLMPHDTDFTVFKRSGKSGVNFAAIGDQWAYHTPNDNLGRVSMRTLQHHGDNALAAIRALSTGDLRHGTDQNVVWFDVLAFFVISWRVHFTVWIAFLALLASITAAALLIREEEATLRGVLHGVLALIGAVIIAALLGFALAWLGNIRASEMWIAHPIPIQIAMWLAGIAAAIGIPSTLRHYTTDSGMLAGEALIWSIAAMALALLLPGASYLAIVPAVVLVARAFIHAFTGFSHGAGAFIASALMSVVLLPAAIALYDGLGNPALPVIAAVVAMAFSPVAFAIDERSIAGAAFAGAIVFTLIAIALPDATHDRPHRVRIVHMTEGTLSRWVVGAPTSQMRNVAHFSHFMWPWAFGYAWETEAPAIANLPQVELNVLSDSTQRGRRIRVLQLHSPRNAARVTLFFHTNATIESMKINGIAPPPRPAHYYELVSNGWHRVALYGGSDATIELVTRGAAPINAVASDMTYGIPETGRALAQARDASNAITTDDGDTTQTLVRKRL